jgi:hypothetical protein
LSRKPTGTPLLLTGIASAGCCSFALHPVSKAAQQNTTGHSGDLESSFIASLRPDLAQQKKPEV